MNGKRALAVFEIGTLVRVKTCDKAFTPSTAFESHVCNVVIKKEPPESVTIELDDGVVLEFLGTWGTDDEEATRHRTS